ncbi:hypothetical protein KI688_004424 [Linnemannia hyalina]|uniref:Uncharacterized protein n=1 Tax=Linnemannia hyalina TaxID=64524 RepID=A0A9P7XLH8_9FUNG|nr:hypothetical protein KI688_004424 [Linnemannia hyalina]
MDPSKSNDTPKGAPPSPRRTPHPTPTPPPRSTNKTKGCSRKNPVATRNKNTYIDTDMGTDTESITVILAVKKADMKRLSSGNRPSLTPGKARKRNADVVDQDPLFSTKRQRKTQALSLNKDASRTTTPVEGGVAYTIPVLVVTKKQNDVPETAIQSYKEGPDEDMDLDEDKESTAASSFELSTGVNGSDATPEGDGLDSELRQWSEEVHVKIAIIAEEPAIPVDEATALTKSSKPPPRHNPIKVKPSDPIVKPTKPAKPRVTTATSTMTAEPIVTVTGAMTAVESLDITTQGTAKDVDVYGSTSNPIIIVVYGSASNPITVDNILTTELITTDEHTQERNPCPNSTRQEYLP